MTVDYDKLRTENIKKYGKETDHLSYLGEDQYADPTHFIFELLQNAEDAGATRIHFKIISNKLEVSHDGRVFNENDVIGICSIKRSTKGDDEKKIGKFGIGFKSVYAYIKTPEIHSGDEHFKIEHYVRPYGVDFRKIEEDYTTLFVLPFKKDEVTHEEAREKIGDCLCNLEATTLLFLRKLKEIRYTLADETGGVYLREEELQDDDQYVRKVRIVHKKHEAVEENEEIGANWLVFERPVSMLEQPKKGKRSVEVGFKLQVKDQNEKKTRHIVSNHDSPLVVFFPTEKKTGLKFLIQGPYNTVPNRENIKKDDGWNAELIKETATLIAESLLKIKKLDLLSVSFLECLPICSEDFPEGSMFYPIFEAVKKALCKEKLLPTNDGKYVSANNAVLARGAGLIDLLSSKQLTCLFQRSKWLTKEITQDKTPELRTYLREELKVQEITSEAFARKLTKEFLEEQLDDWMKQLYEFLGDQKALWKKAQNSYSSAGGSLRKEPIIRLQNESHKNELHVEPFKHNGSPNVYLPNNNHHHTSSFNVVKLTICEHEGALEFLKDLGVPELDLVEEVIEAILKKYKADNSVDSVEEHQSHIHLIEQAWKTDSTEKKNRLREQLCKTRFIRAEDQEGGKLKYRKPDELYFASDKLKSYFDGNEEIAYVDDSIYSESAKSLFSNLGVASEVRFTKEGKDYKGRVELSKWGGKHRRGLDGFDLYICVKGLEHAMESPTPEKSAFIWNEIAIPHSDCIKGLIESSTRQEFIDSDFEEYTSRFGRLLMERAWLPHRNGGSFKKPSELKLEDLPECFERNEKLAQQLGMKLDKAKVLSTQLGIPYEKATILEKLYKSFFLLLNRFEGYPNGLDSLLKSMLQSVTQDAQSEHDIAANGYHYKKTEFPNEPLDPERRKRRKEKIEEEYADAPDKKYEKKEISVRTSRDPSATRTQLQARYTNPDNQMVCQICKQEVRRNSRGEYRFEAVEMLSLHYFPKEYGAQHLALCHDCAADYKEYINPRRETGATSPMNSLRDAIESAEYAEDCKVPIELDKPASIRFTETHFHDLKVILKCATNAKKRTQTDE